MSEPGFDVAIIGAGLMGASIAHHLAAAGAGRIVVLERHYVCAGTTGQSGGILRQHYSNDFTSAMARDSLKRFQNWADEFGGSCGYVRLGIAIMAGPETAEGLRRNVEMHRSLGIDAQLLSPEELRAIDPRIDTSRMEVAAWETDAGESDPVLMVQSLMASAVRQGVQLREGVDVTAIAHANGAVQGVETTHGFVPAKVVVNAGNLWGERLLRPLGYDLELRASRHPMTSLRRTGDFGGEHPIMFDLNLDSYLISRGGHTLSGWLGTHPDDENVDPDNYERGVTEVEIARFRATGSKMLKGLDHFVVQGGWAGIYDDTADGHPILDQLDSYDGLFVALGFSGHGLKLSPEIGRLMAARILGGAMSAPELHPFRFSRFAEGAPITAAFGSPVLG